MKIVGLCAVVSLEGDVEAFKVMIHEPQGNALSGSLPQKGQ